MKLAIMQPYIFPYIGYFQLVNAVDEFVFYDDVNFIKRGWINRNNILMDNSANLFTISCKGISQNKLINEVKLSDDKTQFNKLLKRMEQSYSKAPYFTSAFPVVQKVLNSPVETISEMAVLSVQKVAEYLNMKTNFSVSSESFSESRELEREKRLISICIETGATSYINAHGGMQLYSKESFLAQGIDLRFIRTNPEIKYSQFADNFTPWLSVIDVLMFNSIEETKELLKKYALL